MGVVNLSTEVFVYVEPIGVTGSTFWFCRSEFFSSAFSLCLVSTAVCSS